MFGSITIDTPSYDLGSFMWLPWCPWVPGCHHRGQVAKQMVMTLGMSPEVGQRLLGGQQQGGPFMGALVKLRTRLRDTGLGSKVDCDRDIIVGYSQEYRYFMDF